MEKLMITLAAARVNAGLKQMEVAERMKVSKQTIINWEKGKSEPSTTQADILSDIYNMPRENIFFGTKSYLK